MKIMKVNNKLHGRHRHQIQAATQPAKQRRSGLKGLYMNYSKRPKGTTATSPQLFETKQGPDPAHQHANTQPITATQTHTHTHLCRDTRTENSMTGFHGAMRLGDRAGELTRSQTTGRMMERKRKGTEGEREAGGGSKNNKGGVE